MNKPKSYTTVLIVCVPRDNSSHPQWHLILILPSLLTQGHTEHDYHSVSQPGSVTSLLVTPLPRVLPASLHPLSPVLLKGCQLFKVNWTPGHPPGTWAPVSPSPTAHLVTVSRKETKCLFPLTKVLVGKIKSIEKRMTDSYPCALISVILTLTNLFNLVHATQISTLAFLKDSVHINGI